MKPVTVILMVLLLGLSLMGCQQQDTVQTTEPVETEEVEVKEEIMMGEAEHSERTLNASEDESFRASKDLFDERYPFAIMISNSPEARPQSGFSRAKVLYEMLVEGRTTRYLMVIDRNDDTLIGPVRSARPSFLNTVLEYKAFYGHVGNSYLVYNTIKDFDQFFHGLNAYYRSTHRYAPHNVYAHMNKLYEAAAGEGYDINLPEEGLGHFKVYEQRSTLKDGQPVKSIGFSYDNSTSYVYRYDEAKKIFTKEINGTTMIDEANGETVEIANFIVISLPSQGYMENGIHRRIEYIGRGNATYYAQGQAFDIIWEKESAEKPMKFFYEDKELILQPGLTMINIIEEGMHVDVQ